MDHFLVTNNLEILAYKYTNHDLRSNKEYIASYRFDLPDGYSIYFDYHAKFTFPRNNKITTRDNRLISSKPAESSLFKDEIVFSDENGVMCYYNISKHVFYDKNHKPLVTLIDSTSWLKAIARNALSGDPDTYRICDAIKTSNSLLLQSNRP